MTHFKLFTLKGGSAERSTEIRLRGGGGGGGIDGETETQRQRERDKDTETETDRKKHREREVDSKTLFCKDCSLGSVKNLSNNQSLLSC